MGVTRATVTVGVLVVFGFALFGNTCLHETPSDWPDDHTTQADPTIAVLGDLVVIAFVNTMHYLPLRSGRSSLTGYARSDNGGRTFQDMGAAPAAPDSLGYSNPSLGVSRDGIFFLANLQQGLRGPQVAVARSVDGGRTFEPPVLVSEPKVSPLPDLPHLALAPDQGFVYVVWTDLLLRQVFFSSSADGGRTFAPAMTLSDGDTPKQFARLATGKDGLLYCLWLEPKPSPRPTTSFSLCQLELSLSLYVRRSVDYGQTWSPAVVIATVRSPCNPSAPLEFQTGYVRGGIRAPGIPSAAVDLRTGSLYVAFHSASPSREDNADVWFLAVGSDLTLLVPPTRVNDDLTSSDQFMPALAVSPQGEIGIVFYDRRLDPNNEGVDLFFARSTDGGMTFVNERMTSASFPVPPIVGQPSKTGHFDDLRPAGYFGNYIAIAADGHTFYLAWADGRNVVRTPRYPAGRPDLDVYFARIPTLLRE